MRILLLQNNKIRKIENLGRLKSLVYLNLAINRITRVEGLESLESLHKLDLTVNYIYDYRDFQSISGLTQFEELHAMGNPCESQPYYKDYVAVQLQNLRRFNGHEVTRAERIESSQAMKLHREEVQQFRFAPQNPDWEAETDNSDFEDNDQALKVKRAAQQSAQDEVSMKTIEKKRTKGMKISDQIAQWNDTKFDFAFEELEQTQELLLKIMLPEHLSTDHVKVEVETDWIFVTVKDKTMQLRLSRRVYIDRCRVVRVTTTGCLKIYMPVFEDDQIHNFKPTQKKQKEVKEVVEK